MRALLAAAALALCGCGAIIDFPLPDAGRACTTDSECVPDGCCGQGTGAIHVQDGPACSGVSCSGACPPEQVRCGCGLPVCRDAHCAVAVATDPGCE